MKCEGCGYTSQPDDRIVTERVVVCIKISLKVPEKAAKSSRETHPPPTCAGMDPTQQS